MSPATITLLFLAFAIVMFVTEKIPLGLTSMVVCVGLCVTRVLDVKTAFAGFIDSNVILFVAMFIVGGAFFETGMANEIGGIVTKFARTERSLIVAIMVIVGLMSGVLSNTGTAAVLIPVVIGIAAKSGFKRSRLLMPLVFAAAMGGNLSLIGAPGNMIAQSTLEPLGLKFGFFEYAIVGLPILAAGILFYATIGFRLLPNHDVTDDSDSVFDNQRDFLCCFHPLLCDDQLYVQHCDDCTDGTHLSLHRTGHGRQILCHGRQYREYCPSSLRDRRRSQCRLLEPPQRPHRL